MDARLLALPVLPAPVVGARLRDSGGRPSGCGARCVRCAAGSGQRAACAELLRAVA
jgi:hypothetical protein